MLLNAAAVTFDIGSPLRLSFLFHGQDKGVVLVRTLCKRELYSNRCLFGKGHFVVVEVRIRGEDTGACLTDSQNCRECS